MFSDRSIPYYDKIYSSNGKDYKGETDYLLTVIAAHGISKKAKLLDVACGTGMHIKHFREHFQVEGLDLSPKFAAVSMANNPGVQFHTGDMRNFSLQSRYDVITCLFSAIGYMTSPSDLRAAVVNLGRHLLPQGVLLVEPWLTPDQWKVGRVHMTSVDEEELKIVRMVTTRRKGIVSCFDMHYLIGTPEGVSHFVEDHRAGLFTVDQHKQTFVEAGLNVEYDELGPTGRGLYIGLVAPKPKKGGMNNVLAKNGPSAQVKTALEENEK